MAIVTITSDWGDRDFYRGAVKGKLLSALSDITIVEITHQIEPHNIASAAFILRHSFREFPPGSIHIISVYSTASIDNRHVAVFLDGHYIIGADNGLLSLLSDNKPEKVIEIDMVQDSDYFVFPGRDIFVKAAIKLARGEPVESLGYDGGELREIALWSASTDRDPESGNDRINGKVVYVDNYGNCITNIPFDTFMQLWKNRGFYVHIAAHSSQQSKLYEAYDEVDEGKMLALMSTTGFLEIAINQGRADRLLGLKAYESSVMIEFTDSL
ncbi:MAG: SAM-dependent chlorinase/fluorinase [Bacteroidales bacterium]